MTGSLCGSSSSSTNNAIKYPSSLPSSKESSQRVVTEITNFTGKSQSKTAARRRVEPKIKQESHCGMQTSTLCKEDYDTRENSSPAVPELEPFGRKNIAIAIRGKWRGGE